MEENQPVVVNETDEEIARDSLISGLSGIIVSADTICSPDFEDKYNRLSVLVKQLTEAKKTLDDAIKDIVREHFYLTGETSMSSEGTKYTYVPPTTRETFDTKSFKADNPEEYKKYVKVSCVSDSLRTYPVKEKENPANDSIDG